VVAGRILIMGCHDAGDVFMDGLERETEVMSLFFCGLLWTGMDGSPSTG
jgi:hypothetical protein